MRHSQALSDLISKMSSEDFEKTQDLADSTCTSGYDNDGSTGLEIFKNGYELAAKAKGQPITFGEGVDTMVCLFFIGSEDIFLRAVEANLKEG